MVQRSTDLLHSLACSLMRAGIAAKQTKIKPVVVEVKMTLQWTTVMRQRAHAAAEAESPSWPKQHAGTAAEAVSPSVSHTDTSLLFADGETVCQSRSATQCAAALLNGKPEW